MNLTEAKKNDIFHFFGGVPVFRIEYISDVTLHS